MLLCYLFKLPNFEFNLKIIENKLRINSLKEFVFSTITRTTRYKKLDYLKFIVIIAIYSLDSQTDVRHSLRQVLTFSSSVLIGHCSKFACTPEIL